jgi:serine/threonine protein kinase
MHRDIKPENLVLDENGYVHITDMGIAKLITQQDREIIDSSGTPGYMSPEALYNKHHDLCSDFFSIGIIVYEFMNGRVRDGFNTAALSVNFAERFKA